MAVLCNNFKYSVSKDTRTGITHTMDDFVQYIDCLSIMLAQDNLSEYSLVREFRKFMYFAKFCLYSQDHMCRKVFAQVYQSQPTTTTLKKNKKKKQKKKKQRLIFS